MTADEIVRAKAKARLAQQAGFRSSSASTPGFRSSVPSRLSARGPSRPALQSRSFPGSRSSDPSPIAAPPLGVGSSTPSPTAVGIPLGVGAAVGAPQQVGSTVGGSGGFARPEGGGRAMLQLQEWVPARILQASAVGLLQHLQQWIPTGSSHLQQHGQGVGVEMNSLPPHGASAGAAPGAGSAAGGSFQQQLSQQLPGRPDSAHLRQQQMAAGDQELRTRQVRHYALQQAWLEQVPISAHHVAPVSPVFCLPGIPHLTLCPLQTKGASL